MPDAIAQNHEQMEGGAATPGAQHPSGSEHGAFFNHADAATIAAITERIMPSAPGKPGARDADVLNYIDLALSGAYAELQDFYRRGLASARSVLSRHVIKSRSCGSARNNRTK